jgi:FtsP/CotA-like multicopper oxidase with cupredoxin domain
VVLSVAAGVRGFRLGAPGGWAPPLWLALTLLIHPAHAEDASPQLIQPPVCSAETVGDFMPKGICEVTPLPGGHNIVKINLTAEARPIEVGGYTVVTENYNGNYLTPIVQALAGDTVAAHLTNFLPLVEAADCHHGDAHLCVNPTNLHYFHGGIVTPNNARPKPAETGNGDNIYVYIKNGYSFDFNVPIPEELNGDVLEAKEKDPSKQTTIPYPPGLNWYHSHLHGISSDQVLGGMSGLLSVGDHKANVKAACRKDPHDEDKCTNDVAKETDDLRDRTDAKYVLLRDISLQNVSVPPQDARPEKAKADWAPREQDFGPTDQCGVWTKGVPDFTHPDLRQGFCQRSEKTVWLFTLNGQRFPTITVEGGHNLLLRIGNLSANVAYWLELKKEGAPTNADPLPLTILSVDGVVPARPVDPQDATLPVDASNVPNLLLMPSSRAEIYVRNDVETAKSNDTAQGPQVYILRTKGPDMHSDHWPEIQLARIELKPNTKKSATLLALNAPIEHIRSFKARAALPRAFEIPKGCVRDINPANGEHRRVTFADSSEPGTRWSVLTEIVHPPADAPAAGSAEDKFQPEDSASVGKRDETGKITGGIPFEAYERPDGTIDWYGEPNKHVCIELKPGGASHKQLWVLNNTTTALHNFHIHQMKFRLATSKELEEHHIVPPRRSHACQVLTPPPGTPPSACAEPDYLFYDDLREPHPPGGQLLWHDTIPVPDGRRVFLIMSFDAPQQVGRFVFHCHILKHEDQGLMAPIEVWDPSSAPIDH